MEASSRQVLDSKICAVSLVKRASGIWPHFFVFFSFFFSNCLSMSEFRPKTILMFLAQVERVVPMHRGRTWGRFPRRMREIFRSYFAKWIKMLFYRSFNPYFFTTFFKYLCSFEFEILYLISACSKFPPLGPQSGGDLRLFRPPPFIHAFATAIHDYGI